MMMMMMIIIIIIIIIAVVVVYNVENCKNINFECGSSNRYMPKIPIPPESPAKHKLYSA